MTMPRLKEWAIGVARRLGYEIVPTARVMPRGIATHLQCLFTLLNIDCVLDVGANMGQFRDMLRHEVHYHGLIVSFEPGHACAQALIERARNDSQWIIQDVALGARDTTRTLNVMQSRELSSFLAPDNSETAHFAPFNVVDHTEQVHVRTLDTVLNELRHERAIGPHVMLKIDTQGYDLEVLKGAQQSLASISAIQTELACQKIYRGMPGYLDVLEVLDRNGFQLSGVFPVSQDTGLRIIEADCVVINRAQFAGQDLHLMWTNAI